MMVLAALGPPQVLSLPALVLLLLLLQVASVLFLDVCKAAPPTVTHAEYQTRVLNLATVHHDQSVEWQQYKMGVFRVDVSQPLFLTSSYHGTPIHARFNRSAVASSLRDSMLVTCECPGGGAKKRGPVKLAVRPWSRALNTAFWTAPRAGQADAVVAPVHSPENEYDELMDIFEAFEVDSDHDNSGSSTIELMVLLAHVLPDSSLRSGPLPDDCLSECHFEYTPIAKRPRSAKGLSKPRREYVTAVELLDDMGAALSNFGGEELSAVRVPLTPSADCCQERSIVRMSDEKEWSKDLVEQKQREHAANGTLLASRRHKTEQFVEMQALIQSRMKVGMPLGLMFDPIMSGVLKPVIEITAEYMCGDLMAVFTNDMFHTIITEVTPDVSLMLHEVLTANLTNILADSVTYTLSKSLTMALTRALGPFLVNKISAELTPILHIIFDHVLLKRIPHELNGFLPDLLDRVLPITATHALTRSVTHALIPTLTHTMTHTRASDKFCYMCYYHSMYCSKCHFSQTTAYYQSYHSTYYSDYFANYYADYYADALMALDATLYPGLSGDKPP